MKNFTLKRTWIHNMNIRKLTYVYMMHASENNHFYVLIFKITIKLFFFLPFLHTSGIILTIVQSIKVMFFLWISLKYKFLSNCKLLYYLSSIDLHILHVVHVVVVFIKSLSPFLVFAFVFLNYPIWCSWGRCCHCLLCS